MMMIMTMMMMVMTMVVVMMTMMMVVVVRHHLQLIPIHTISSHLATVSSLPLQVILPKERSAFP